MPAPEAPTDSMQALELDPEDPREELGESAIRETTLAAFEREYEDDFSWETLAEDASGRLQTVEGAAARRARASLQGAGGTTAAERRIRRGLVRHLVLVLDCSRAAAGTDLRPDRGTALARAGARFLRQFFDENPLGHACIVALRDGVASKLSAFSGGPAAQRAALQAARAGGFSGAASLQNGLDLARDALRHAPRAGTKEALFLLAALSSADAGDIRASAAAAAAAGVRASFVGIGAEVFVCRDIAGRTKGTYDVVGDEGHMEDALAAHARPPRAAPGAGAGLVEMGFPARLQDVPGEEAFVGEGADLRSGGYRCPRCASLVADVPCACHVCGLSLASAPRLARSYRYLFPIAPHEYCDGPADGADGRSPRGEPTTLACSACDDPLPAGEPCYRCTACRAAFHATCAAFLREALHNCPGCERRRADGGGAGGREAGGAPAAPKPGRGVAVAA